MQAKRDTNIHMRNIDIHTYIDKENQLWCDKEKGKYESVHIFVVVYFFLKLQDKGEEENKSRKMNIHIFTAQK
jgi:hypothetical protein